jgi:hypothetical protein
MRDEMDVEKLIRETKRLTEYWTVDERRYVMTAVADHERMRAALREIADSGDFSSGSDWGDLVLSRDIARKALTTCLGEDET